MITKSKIKSILFISLSNLGDIILTTPVFLKLHDEFPKAKIDVITGAPGKAIFVHHPAVREVTVPKRPRTFGSRLRQVVELRRRRYDLVVDMKNSLIPYIVGARFHSRLSLPFTGKGLVRHKTVEHLARLSGLVDEPFSNTSFFIPATDAEKDCAAITARNEEKKIVIVNPGAKSPLKRWGVAKYTELTDRLVSELDCKVLIIGNEDDREVVQRLVFGVKSHVTDLCCKTSLGVLSELMRHVDLVITNDSAPLHVASASGVPAIAIFGPTDERKYGPLAERSVVVAPKISCRPCDSPRCVTGPAEGCISRVKVEEVFEAAKKLLRGA